MTASEMRRAEARGNEFFSKHLEDADREVFSAIENELERQQNEIELIASENIVSRAVLDAAGTLLTNKYAEVIRAGAITVAANMSMSSSNSPSTAPSACSIAPSPMSSRIRARRQISR